VAPLSLVRAVLLLGTIVALGPLTIDMYLPSLPSIVDDLHADATAVQLTLAGTLIGLALGQLVVGPISDAVGRRTPLLYGFAVHVVASLLCLVAPNVAVLGTLRVLQGVGMAATGVVAMAVVRDLYSGVAAAKVMSRLMLVMGAAPILAPTLGGLVLRVTTWRGIFAVLAVLGVAIATVALRYLPETLPPARRVRGGVTGTLRAYGQVLRDRSFVGLVLVAGLSMAGLFAYVSGSSFVLQEQYGLSKQAFGFVFGAGALGLIAATQFNVYLLGRFSPRRILVWSLAVAFAASLVLVAVSVTGFGGLVGLLVPLWVVLAGAGLAIPNAPALALSRHGEAAGTAAAMLGAVQFGIAALTTPLVGVLGATSLAMAVVIAAGLALGLVAMFTIVRSADIENIDGPAEPALVH
jgi:DHA1 family bicyclomycin/chloramphenicol resistance-like MFS transporter